MRKLDYVLLERFKATTEKHPDCIFEGTWCFCCDDCLAQLIDFLWKAWDGGSNA